MLDAQLRSARILLIDDEEDNVRTLEKILRRSGFDRIDGTTDPRRSVKAFRDFHPDLVLLDLHMPHLDGFHVMDSLRPLIPRTSYLPILVLTGDLDPGVRQRALAAGARDFLTKPFEVTEVLLRIKNLLETRLLHRQLELQNETLELRVKERTRELGEAQIEILQRLAVAAEYRDDITGRHAERVGALSSMIGESVGLSADVARLLRRAAPLHDVGKIGIPDAILMKPGPLTTEEFTVMKTHAAIGARILSGSRYPLLKLARTVALSHHERWDGNGYPRGRAGDRIPLVGRIVAVADVFDSLTHERPYKRAFSRDEALGIMADDRGAHFDPEVFDAFIEIMETVQLADLERAAELAGPATVEREPVAAVPLRLHG